jgi:hypothetical protein
LLYMFLLFKNPQFEWYMIAWSMIIAGPAFIIGILWLLNWKNKQKLIKENKKRKK